MSDPVSEYTKLEAVVQMLTYPITLHVMTLCMTDDDEMEVRLKPAECENIMDVIDLWKSAGGHVCGDIRVGAEAAQEFVLRQVIVTFAAQNGLDISADLQGQVDMAHACIDLLHRALGECLDGDLPEEPCEDFFEESTVLVDGIGRLAHHD